MSYRQHLLDCIKSEVETCKYLYSRIAPEHLAFRPRAGLRSVEELLRYLSWCAVESVASFISDKAAGDNYIYYARCGDSMSIANFPEAMDNQMEEIAQLFASTTEDDLYTKTVVYPWRAKAPLGEAIMETSVKRLAAYKMQLFITMKMAGNDELNTLDCWIRPYLDKAVREMLEQCRKLGTVVHSLFTSELEQQRTAERTLSNACRSSSGLKTRAGGDGFTLDAALVVLKLPSFSPIRRPVEPKSCPLKPVSLPPVCIACNSHKQQ